MKKAGFLLLMILALASCSKNNEQIVTGTVIQQGGFTPTSYIVTIDNAAAGKYSFICANGLLSSASYNCGNAVFILNLPVSLQSAGKKIQFSRFKDKGPSLVSSAIFVPHDLEVYNATEIP